MIGLGLTRAALLSRTSATAPAAYVFTNSEAAAVAARMATPPTNARSALIDTLVGALKNGATSSSNIWNKLDALWVLAAADSQASLVDWKNAADLTVAGAPAFVPDHGWTPAISTGFLTAGTFASQMAAAGSGHIGVFTTTSTATNAKDVGYSSSNGFVTAADGLTRSSIGGTGAALGPTGTGTQHVVGSRTTTTSLICYRNGVAGTTNVVSGTTPLSFTGMTVCGSGGSTSSDRQLGAVHCGVGLTTAEVLDLYNALQAYLHAVGAV